MTRTRLAQSALAFTFVALVFSSSLGAREITNTVVENPKEGTAEWVVSKTLEAGMANTMEAWYGTHCHPNYCLGTPRNKKNFVKYRWKRLRKWVESYYVDVAKGTFEVVRTDPKDFDEKTDRLKLFLKSSKRDMPVPIEVRRDKKGAWKVHNMSL
jgi:hypothetical protein